MDFLCKIGEILTGKISPVGCKMVKWAAGAVHFNEDKIIEDVDSEVVVQRIDLFQSSPTNYGIISTPRLHFVGSV